MSNFSCVYGISNITAGTGLTELAHILSLQGFGPVNAYALMVFCLMYTPCVAAIGTIKRETKSLSWTGGMVLFQLAAAWIMAVIVFQVGSLVF